MQSHVQLIIHQTPHTLKYSRFDILYTPRSKYNMSSKYFFVNGIWPFFFLNNSHFYKNRRLIILRERSTVYYDTNFQSFYISTLYKGIIYETFNSIIENNISSVHQFNCITTRTFYLLYNHGLLFRNIWIIWVNHYHFVFIFIKLPFYVTPIFFNLEEVLFLSDD